MIPEVEKYIKKGYKRVEGYYESSALEVIANLGFSQQNLSLNGAICEIGVHHGRSFILLCLLSSKDEICIAYDLFEQQEQNENISGKGDKEKFLTNLKKYDINMDRVKIDSINSLELTAEKILSQIDNKIRIFSIDGGHQSNITYNDLDLADKTLCKGGIIIIDDYFDFKWPGVSEGTCKYLLNNPQRLYPFAIVDDKLMLSNDREKIRIYKHYLMDLVPKYIIKKSHYFNSEVLIIFQSRRKIVDFLRRTKFWQNIKENNIGNLIRHLVSRF